MNLWEDADAICAQCGHERWEHADTWGAPGCSAGWIPGAGSMSGRLVEGPDGCACGEFSEQP